MKQATVQMSQNNWMGVFLDMSKATQGAEKAEVSCKFPRKWVAKLDRVVMADGEHLPRDMTAVQTNVSNDMFQSTESVAETTQERKLIAY